MTDRYDDEKIRTCEPHCFAKLTNGTLTKLAWSRALLPLALTVGCSDAQGDIGKEPDVDTVALDVQTDEPGHDLDAYPGVVEILPVGCTGWMLNSRVIVTAAHCLPNQGAAVTNIMINYFKPGVGKTAIHASSTPAEVRRSPSWEGSIELDGVLANPLEFTEEAAKHDVGFIKLDRSWPGTTYEDYLRVYSDDMETLTSVYVYGRGLISNGSSSSGNLRYSHFDVDPGWFASDLVIWTRAGDTERLCAGDSGGPYIKKILGLDLVAGSHSRSDRLGSQNCPGSAGEQFGEKLTWDGPDDFEWLRAASETACDFYTPSGQGNNYARCFELPFINDAPDREQEHAGKEYAVAVAVAALF